MKSIARMSSLVVVVIILIIIIIILILIIIIAFECFQPTHLLFMKIFKNLLDMPSACRMRMSLWEAEKLQPWGEDGAFARRKR